MGRTAASLLVLAALLAVGLGPLAGPAAADRGNGAEQRSIAAEHKRIVNYWTAQRRAKAIPRDVLLLDSHGKPVERAKPGGAGPATSGAWTQGGDVAVTTGKVFFTLGGVNYVCSGSAVATPSGGTNGLVLSAGHCVHEGDGSTFATNWAFYPRYKSGSDPALGAWTATDLFTTDEWAKNGNFDHDASFAVVTNGSATSLESAVAAQGAPAPPISFSNNYTSGTFYSFGYPAAGKFNGQTLQYCSGTLRVGWDGHETVSMPCDMTGGSSGGPWFRSWNSTEKTGTVASLNSYGYQSVKNVMFGPIFNGPEQDAYNAATGGNCGGVGTTSTFACKDL